MRAYAREQRELRRPGTRKKPSIGGGDPLAWLTHLVYVEALEISPSQIPPPDEDDEEFDTGDGVSTGELHLQLRQLHTLRRRYRAAELDHEKAAELETDLAKRDWHREQEDRCEMFVRVITLILAISTCDAHGLYGPKTSYKITSDWIVKRMTNF